MMIVIIEMIIMMLILVMLLRCMVFFLYGNLCRKFDVSYSYQLNLVKPPNKWSTEKSARLRNLFVQIDKYFVNKKISQDMFIDTISFASHLKRQKW